MVQQNQVNASGVILEEFTNLKGSLGLVYFKGSDLFKVRQVFDRPSLIFSRCHSILQVECAGEKGVQLDAYVVLALPSNTEHTIIGVTPISHVASFIPDNPLFEETSKLYSISAAEWPRLFSKRFLVRRPNWLNEVMHRYVFERATAKNANNCATSFLETELLKEIYYASKDQNLALKNRFNLDDNNLDKKSPLVRKAMIFIESRLFEVLSMEELSKNLAASGSTILRAFSKDLGKSPFNYIKERRLEEANVLIRSCKYSVSEVASLVGYENTSAFIAAFKKHFGLTPSTLADK